MKINDTDVSDFVIRAGDNVNIIVDPDTKQCIISAPVSNQTSIQQGPFLLKGESIELISGNNIKMVSVGAGRRSSPM